MAYQLIFITKAEMLALASITSSNTGSKAAHIPYSQPVAFPYIHIDKHSGW